MGQKRPGARELPVLESVQPDLSRPKARRTGPAIPVSVSVFAAGALPPPCMVSGARRATRGGDASGIGARRPEGAEEGLGLQQTASGWPSMANSGAMGLRGGSRGPEQQPPPEPSRQQEVQQQQQQQQQQHNNQQQQQEEDGAVPQPMSTDDEHRPASPDTLKGQDQQQESSTSPPQQQQQPHPPAAAPRKAVRFAPGPLTPPPQQRGAGAATRAVSADGHPAGEGLGAVPVRQFNPGGGSYSFPSDPVTRSNIALLEELLGPENAPSLGRLKRRAGILPPARPPRVQLTTARQTQRQVA